MLRAYSQTHRYTHINTNAHTHIVDSIIRVYKYSFDRQLEKAREDDVLQHVTLKRDNDLGDINEKMVERVELELNISKLVIKYYYKFNYDK